MFSLWVFWFVFLFVSFFFFFPWFLKFIGIFECEQDLPVFLESPCFNSPSPPTPPKWAVTLFLAISACFIRNNYSIRANNYICVCFSLGFFFNTKDRFVFNETPSTGKQRFEHCFKRKICHKLLECS